MGIYAVFANLLISLLKVRRKKFVGAHNQLIGVFKKRFQSNWPVKWGRPRALYCRTFSFLFWPLGRDLKHWFEVAGDKRQLSLVREPRHRGRGNCVGLRRRRETCPGELGRLGKGWATRRSRGRVTQTALGVRARTIRAWRRGRSGLLLVVTESHSFLVDSCSAS